eukprot:GILK01009422.1.p1 GENE.GILK01009422.1~~GILK01009422.1.p1  ORF type:complete len:693 (+),score=78.57 GILK01009422.1:26-2080(+)
MESIHGNILALLRDLNDTQHLKRERALLQLQSLFEQHRSHFCEDEFKVIWEEVEGDILQKVGSSAWEHRFAGLQIAKIVIRSVDRKEYRIELLKAASNLITDPEHRVRLALGGVLEALAERDGVSVYERIEAQLLASMGKPFEDRRADRSQDPFADSKTEEQEQEEEQFRQSGVPEDLHHHSMSADARVYSVEDLQGWSLLESSIKILQDVITGVGQDFTPYIKPFLVNLLTQTIHHNNRFLREAGLSALGVLCKNCSPEILERLSPAIVPLLCGGLSDNWSSVRYAATAATHEWMLSAIFFRELFFPQLLPRMSVNRYYVAEGVRLYALGTWTTIVGTKGLGWLAELAKETCEFYVSQCDSENHAVREAACHCIGELGAKVALGNSEPFKEYVPQLMQALQKCFKDESWPVRDAACTACGAFITGFTAECRPVLDQWYELWFAHLSDNVPAVREHSAIALGNVVRIYKEEAWEVVLRELRRMIGMAREHPFEATDSHNLSTVAGSTQPFRSDPVGSARQSGPLEGVVDYGFTRPKEPWEASDGCVYLVRELCTLQSERIVNFVVQLADLAGPPHIFPLQVTIWRELPKIARIMGKQHFKRILDVFIEPLFLSLSSGQRHVMDASGYCISLLNQFVGPSIFAGRVENVNPHFLQVMRTSDFVDLNVTLTDSKDTAQRARAAHPG